ncbi:MAG: glycerophosphodiester phosphodiesterase family protein [Bacteroidota bacterium]
MKSFSSPALFLSILSLTALLACKSTATQTSSSPSLQEYFAYAPDKAVLISAHRGGRFYPAYPENCLETIQHVYAQIPTAIFEIDVARTRDGILILMHDNSVDRTTTGSGKVDQLNWADIQMTHLKDDFGKQTNFRVPSLDQVLNWADDNQVILMVDVKRSVPYEDVLQYLEQADALDNAVIITYSANQAKKLYQLNPDLVLSVSIRNHEELQRMEETGIPARNMVAFTGTRDSPKSLFDAIHAKGMMCILGTLGNLDKQAEAKGGKIYLDFVDKGINIFATDRPLEVAKVLGK